MADAELASALSCLDGSGDPRGRARRVRHRSRSSSRRGNGDPERHQARPRGHPRPAPPRGVAAVRPAAVRTALDHATRHLTGLQNPAGWWKGELETNVTMDAEDLLLREFLGIRTDEETQAPPAGSGPASAPTAPGPTSAAATPTCPPRVEAYVALRLAGDPPDDPHMARAAGCISAARRHRGDPGLHPHLAGAVRRVVVGRTARYAAGDHLPAPWFPLNVYDWACWARQTIVPLTIVVLRPARAAAAVRPRRAGLAGDARPAGGARARDRSGGLQRMPGPGVLRGLDRALHA